MQTKKPLILRVAFCLALAYFWPWPNTHSFTLRWQILAFFFFGSLLLVFEKIIACYFWGRNGAFFQSEYYSQRFSLRRMQGFMCYCVKDTKPHKRLHTTTTTEWFIRGAVMSCYVYWKRLLSHLNMLYHHHQCVTESPFLHFEFEPPAVTISQIPCSMLMMFFFLSFCLFFTFLSFCAAHKNYIRNNLFA